MSVQIGMAQRYVLQMFAHVYRAAARPRQEKAHDAHTIWMAKLRIAADAHLRVRACLRQLVFQVLQFMSEAVPRFHSIVRETCSSPDRQSSGRRQAVS